MKILHLDGNKMLDPVTAHHYLAEKLQAPAWYGHNLDALWDLLSELDPCQLVVHHPFHQAPLSRDIKQVLEKAAATFSHIKVDWIQESDVDFSSREPSSQELSELGILFHPRATDRWLLAHQGLQLVGLACVREGRLHWLYSQNPWIQEQLLQAFNTHASPFTDVGY